MPLAIQVGKEADPVVFHLAGRMTMSDPLNELEDQVKTMVKEGTRHVVLDLGKISYVDSTGLGVLVGVLTTVTRAGGDMQLSNVPPRIQALLDVSNLNQVFQIVKSAMLAPEIATNS